MAAKSSGQNVTPPQPKDSHVAATTTSKTPKTTGRKRNHVTKKPSPNHHQNHSQVDTVTVENENHQDAKKDNEQQSRKRVTPPHKRLRKLRLCDTPHTPKTLLKKSQLGSLPTSSDEVAKTSDEPTTALIKTSEPHENDVTPPQLIKESNVYKDIMKNATKTPKVTGVSTRKRTSAKKQVNCVPDQQERQQTVVKNPSTDRLHKLHLQQKATINKALNFEDTDTDENELTIRHNVEIRLEDECLFKPIKKLTNLTSERNIMKQNACIIQRIHAIESPNSPCAGQMLPPTSINPFTPTHSVDSSSRFITSSGLAKTIVRQVASDCEDIKGGCGGESRRLPIRQCEVSRYHQEFHEVCKLGSGEFGDVFKCINRLDGCTYAIKRSKLAIAGSALEVAAWKEVCAHAVLVKHNHIVQYYSAWAEMDRMLIQNEYCNGGSLAEFLDTLRLSNMHTTNTATSAGLLSLPPSPSPSCSSSTSSNPSSTIMSECDLKTLLLHVAKGLSYMHSLHLAHLDIKPGNIFICRSPRRQQIHSSLQQSSMKGVGGSLTSTTTTTTTMESVIGASSSSALLVSNEESGIESDDLDESETESTTSSVLSSSSSVFSDIITYKIGDLGHVTSTLHENPHVEEGDCRYLPNEILQENYSWLVKADVFALALTVFVAGSLEDLPKNGDEWHWIRQGNLKDLHQCSDRFKKLLQLMIHEDPSQRPSASTLVHHPCICPDSTKSKSQLRKELNQEKFKNEMLQRKVKKYEEQIHKLDSPLNPIAPNIRHLNQDLSRSKQKIARSFSSTGLI